MLKSLKKIIRKKPKRQSDSLHCDVLNLDRRLTLGQRRLQIAAYLDRHFNSTVAYGPFKGFQLDQETWWNKKDRGGMLLGLYEQEILKELTQLPANYKTFIDLGAADGYYGVGVLVNNTFATSYCFEMSAQGREVIAANAKRNHVQDRVVIYGTAEKDFYQHIPASERANCVLFIDIEGAEFDLLDTQTLAAFKDAVIIVELHHWFYEDGDERLAKLKADAANYFTIKELKTGARELSGYSVLEEFSDDDRWLVCSEGRKRLMSWLRFDPK